MKYGIFDEHGRPTAFYDDKINNNIPAEAVFITDAQWRALIDDQEMKRFVGGQVVTRTKSLDEVRNSKLAALEKLRIKKAEGGLTIANKRIPTDKAALVLLQSAQMFLAKNPGKKFKKAGLGEFTVAAVDSLINAIGDFQLPIYEHESNLYDQVMACTTVEQVEAIDITAGWPEG